MSKHKHKHAILAIVLSLLVIVGWQYFVGYPQMERQRQEAQLKQQPLQAQTQPRLAQSNAPKAQTQAASREVVIDSSPRVAINTPRLGGSINLKGGGIDDLTLTQFREETDPTSPPIVLFSPSGAPGAFYAEFGWVPARASNAVMPGPDTGWKQQGSGALGVGHPVTLTYDNGQGLVFTRAIAVDEHYLFTVKDTIANNSGSPVTLFPYALISRHGVPMVQHRYILHEGLIGVMGDQGLQEMTYKKIEDAKSQTWDVTGIDFPFGPGGYNQALGLNDFDMLIDWGFFTFFPKLIFIALDFFFHLVGNFGIAILIVATIFKLIFSPFANSSYRAMSKMKLLEPQVEAIRQKFPDDKESQSKEIIDLYKRENVSAPSGCLPIVVQWFIFFMVYKALVVPVEMRHAPFGWVNDLSAPDPTNIFNLFGLIPFDPSLYFSFLNLGAWPVITGVTVWLLQRRISPALFGPVQRQVFGWMPFLIPFFIARFPAGWIMFLAWYNFLSIIHQWLLRGKIGVVGNISEYSARILPWGKIQPIVFLMMLAPITQNVYVLLFFWRRSKSPLLDVTVPNTKATTAKNRPSWSWVPVIPRKAAGPANAGANVKSSMSDDDADAIQRYRKAAEQGDAQAQSILGLMYFTGRGVLQDYVEAHMWLNLAASRFSTADIRNRDQAIRDRDHVAAKMTPARIAEAQKLAREWKPKPGR